MANEQEWRRTLEGSLGIPATEGDDVEVVRDGVTIFPAMIEAIESVTRTVDLLTFVYSNGGRCRVILEVPPSRRPERSRGFHSGARRLARLG